MNNDKINFYLPDFFYLFNLNDYIIRLTKTNPEYFRDNIVIKSVYGTFPGTYWNGGRTAFGSTNMENIECTIQSLNVLDVAVRFTFTNSLIDEHLIHDPYCNEIMKIADNGKNEVLLNNKILEDYLRNKYPNFKYISSTTKCILNNDEINNECEKYDLVVLDYRKNADKESHKQFKYIDKLELLINAYCSPDCKMRKEHYRMLSETQLNGRTPPQFTCSGLQNGFFDMMKLSSTIKPEDLYGYYVDKGFRHFKIEGRTLHYIDAIEAYVTYLVKPEYKDKLRYEIIKYIWR